MRGGGPFADTETSGRPDQDRPAGCLETGASALEGLKFAHDWQQVVLQEYIDAVKAASERVKSMTDQMMRVLPQWRMAPIVDALTALRGLDKLSAMTLLAELGDIKPLPVAPATDGLPGSGAQ